MFQQFPACVLLHRVIMGRKCHCPPSGLWRHVGWACVCKVDIVQILELMSSLAVMRSAVGMLVLPA